MAASFLFDVEQADLAGVCMSRAQVYEVLPHAHEFQLIGGVCLIDTTKRRIVSFSDITQDDWWVRAHVPGRPIFPGVLMLEMAAQTSAVLAKSVQPSDAFIGFGGVADCKFRQAVTPGVRLHILGVGAELRKRRIVCKTQGVVEGRLVFEATITGLILP